MKLKTKKCTKCLLVLPHSAYTPHHKNQGGVRSRCRRCEAAVKRERCRRPDVVLRNRAYYREYYMKNRDAVQRKARLKDERRRRAGLVTVDPYRFRARYTLRHAVTAGRIKKPKECEGCGWIGNLHGHHHKGYNKPLDVQWLCSICHGKKHRKPDPEVKRAN